MANDLRVTHYCLQWLGLTETWLHTQIRSLPPGVKSNVVCESTANLDQFFIPDICSLESVPRSGYLWDKGLRWLGVRNHLGFLSKMLEEFDADILHSHYGHAGWSNIGAARKEVVRHVVTFYGLDVNYLPRTDRRWLKRYAELFCRADLILCEGEHMAKCIVEMGCPPEKVSVHHLGVRLERIPFRPRQWDSASVLRILIAAAFREKKGIPYALEALALLGREVPLEITIIGDANQEKRSQAEKARILETIGRHGLGERVRLLGYRPHDVFFEEAYKHHIFLCPSVTACDGDTEGGAPVSLIEAIASGMPVVTTRHCDIPEVARNEVATALAEERDVEGLVQIIRWLLNNREKWDAIAGAGRKHIEREFDAEEQGRKLAGIYRSLRRV